MRLSDVKGERTFDVIADVIEPIANIADNPNAAELFTRRQLPEGMTPRKFIMERITKHAPVLLREHKQDLVKIFSTIEGISEDEYKEKLNLVNLITGLFQLMTDEVFNTFFISAGTTGEASSGDATENTEAGA